MTRKEAVEKAARLIAKVKFWFGAEEPIFDLTKYEVEIEGQFAYIYRK